MPGRSAVAQKFLGPGFFVRRLKHKPESTLFGNLPLPGTFQHTPLALPITPQNISQSLWEKGGRVSIVLARKGHIAINTPFTQPLGASDSRFLDNSAFLCSKGFSKNYCKFKK